MSKSSPGIACAYAAMTTLQIPDHWSAEQALAVWELLDDIAGIVWDRYELQLIELIQSELCEGESDQLDLFDPDDRHSLLKRRLKTLSILARRDHTRASRFMLPALFHLP